MAENTKAQFSIEFDEEGGTVPGVTQLLNPKLMAEQDAKKASKSPPPILKKNEFAKDLPTRIIDSRANQVTPATPEDKTGLISISEGIDIGVFSSSATASHLPPAETLPKKADAHSAKLKQLGVSFELHFEKKQNFFRYTKIKSHSELEWQAWQEQFFYLMKIDLSTLGIQISFQEFSEKQHPFHADAFGLAQAGFVQIVRVESEPEKMFILLSNQSLLLKQEEVRAALLGKSNSKEDDDGEDFKIELAS